MRYDLFIRGYAKLREYQALVRHVINHVRVVVRIDHTDPLVHAGTALYVSRLQGQPRKCLVNIGDDGARLVHREIAMPQDRHAIEGMQSQMDWHADLRLEVMERVGHLLVCENQPHDVNECAAWKPVNDWIGHITLLDFGYCRCKRLVVSPPPKRLGRFAKRLLTVEPYVIEELYVLCKFPAVPPLKR